MGGQVNPMTLSSSTKTSLTVEKGKTEGIAQRKNRRKKGRKEERSKERLGRKAGGVSRYGGTPRFVRYGGI